MTTTNDNSHLWDQFIRLGERIGDGDLDASESKWMNREYRKLAKILIQETPEEKERNKQLRQLKAENINIQMTKLLQEKKCACGGKLSQARSGSKIAYCDVCNSRYKASGKKK